MKLIGLWAAIGIAALLSPPFMARAEAPADFFDKENSRGGKAAPKGPAARPVTAEQINAIWDRNAPLLKVFIDCSFARMDEQARNDPHQTFDQAHSEMMKSCGRALVEFRKVFDPVLGRARAVEFVNQRYDQGGLPALREFFTLTVNQELSDRRKAYEANKVAQEKSLAESERERAYERLRTLSAVHFDCLTNFVIKNVGSGESAATLIDASFGACQAEESAYRKQLEHIPGVKFSYDDINELTAGSRRTKRERLLSELIEARSMPANADASKPAAVAPSATSESTTQQPKASSSGSGFFVSANGHLVTNQHVIDGCKVVQITGGAELKVVAADKANDLALLEEPGRASKALAFRSHPVTLGEEVVAFGYPLSGYLDNGLNATTGTISSETGPSNDSRSLQFTAPIQPGNSGGPVVDRAGRVVAVATSTIDAKVALAAIGTVPQGLNWGMRSEIVLPFLRANRVEPLLGDKDGASLTVAEVAANTRESAIPLTCKN